MWPVEEEEAGIEECEWPDDERECPAEGDVLFSSAELPFPVPLSPFLISLSMCFSFALSTEMGLTGESRFEVRQKT